MLGTLSVASAAFVLGALVSLGASWILVTRLERIGERFGLSEALLGLLTALAADTPEITAAVTALVHHQRTVGAGVVIGSNAFNLAALLGLGAIVAGRIELHRKVVLLGGSVALGIALLCMGAVTKVIDPPTGLGIGLAVMLAYAVVLSRPVYAVRWKAMPSRWARWLASAVDEEELELGAGIRPHRAEPRDFVTAVIALAAVIVASVEMERGASSLGANYHVPSVVLGGLVLAAVTSMPNAVAAVYLARHGRGAAAFSTALNSNAVNVVAGLLLPATFLGVSSPTGSTLLIAGTYLGLTLLTLVLAFTWRGLRQGAGWLIVAGYAALVVALLATS